jgi:hypothetical protein
LKTTPLAPIVVEILLCRGSAQKIAADSGNSSLLKQQSSLKSFLYIIVENDTHLNTDKKQAQQVLRTCRAWNRYVLNINQTEWLLPERFSL